MEREKFRANKDYDEMRLLRIHLKPKVSEGEIDIDELEVKVAFYDRNVRVDEVVPSRIVTPESSLRVQERWATGEKKTLTAVYMLPKGFRANEEKEFGETQVYEGYKIQIFYKQQLQDQVALPKTLLAQDMPLSKTK